MSQKGKRVIIFDTETTGLKAKEGHRLVEFGGVELIDGVETGNYLQLYFNPQMEIPQEAIAIHGITNEMVKNQPTFAEQADKLIEFIAGAELVAHNAEFDKEMIDHELKNCNKGSLYDYVKVITDTLFIAKAVLANDLKKFNLDALSSHFQIKVPKLEVVDGRLVETQEHIPQEGKKFDRGLHGALIDAKILSKVYQKMNLAHSQEQLVDRVELNNWVRPAVQKIDNSFSIPSIEVSPMDQLENLKYNLFILEKSKGDKEAIEALKEKISAIEDTIEPVVVKKSFSFKF